MSEGIVQIYYGEGHGKSTAAVGNAIAAATIGKQATIVQFLKGKNELELSFLSRLEPEVKIFNFAKTEVGFEELDEEKRQEEIMNLKNGFNYSKKVITTGECDIIVLDEILGLVHEGIIDIKDLTDILENRPEEVTIICTGRVLDDRVRSYADEIYNIAPEK